LERLHPHENGRAPAAPATGDGGGGLDLQALLQRALRNWYLFVLFLLLGYLGARLYLRYTPERYWISGKVFIRGDGESTPSSDQLIRQELGMQEVHNKENDIQLLKSRGLMEQVVEDLDLNVNYLGEGRLTKTDFYGRRLSPVRVAWHQLPAERNSAMFKIRPLDARTYEMSTDDWRQVYPYGERVSNRFGAFIIVPDSTAVDPKDEILINIVRPKQLAANLAGQVAVYRIGQSDLLEIGIASTVPKKGADIIERLAALYDRQNMAENSRRSMQALAFVDDRLDYLNGELTEVELQAEDFIVSNDIIGGPERGLEAYLEEMRNNDLLLAELRSNLQVLQATETALARPVDEFNLVPFDPSVSHLSLNTLLSEYHEGMLERERLLITARPNNPTVRALEDKLDKLRRNIDRGIAGARAEINEKIADLKRENNRILATIRTLPGKERGLVGIAREQKVKEQLYLYLLQKREETALTQASATSSVRLVESPVVSGSPISPKPLQVYGIGLLLGLLLPLGFIAGRELLDDAVYTPDQIRAATAAPFLGSISGARVKTPIVVSSDSRSVVAEMFRLLRTNLHFLAAGERQQVILITSSMSGEGKSFVTVNLGISLALSGKRVCLLGMDLRRPTLASYLPGGGGDDDDDALGVSTYLAGDLPVEAFIRASGLHPHLDFIGSGPLPPNPGELLLSERRGKLFEELRLRYDAILVDTSPVGSVADALLLGEQVDLTLYIVRSGYTKRRQLRLIEDIFQDKKLGKMAVVLNGVNPAQSRGYEYGYGYTYESYQSKPAGKGKKYSS
jgi:tyrosine-protein kinase Etk/Wzc